MILLAASSRSNACFTVSSLNLLNLIVLLMLSYVGIHSFPALGDILGHTGK